MKGNEEAYQQLKQDLYEIHMSIDEEEYEEMKLEFKKFYSKKFPDMYEYINAQWFSSDFNKWQIFRNNPGFANTNSNIESFNNVIKRDFTGRRKLSVKVALDKINDMIEYYSTNYLEFQFKPAFDRKMLSNAKKLSDSNFKKIKSDKISYKGSKNNHVIKLNDRECFKNYSCNCRTFLKSGVCTHLLGYSIINNLNIYDENEILKRNDNFVQRNKRGRHGLAKKAYIRE
jgi:hypothetical protein